MYNLGIGMQGEGEAGGCWGGGGGGGGLARRLGPPLITR